MIARMSKVEIIGEKDLLHDILSLLQEMGIFQLEPADISAERMAEQRRMAFSADEKTAFERLFLEDVRQKIDELVSRFPEMPVRKSYIQPQSIIGTIAYTVEKHITICRKLHEKKTSVQKEISELSRYIGFLSTLMSISKGAHIPPDFDIIGLTLKDPSAVQHLRTVLSRLTGDKFKLFTVPAGDGTLWGMITIEKNVVETVSRTLSSEQIPEMSFPPSFKGFTVSEKIAYLEEKTAELSSAIEAIDREMENMCRRWAPIYRAVKEWVNERLSLLKAVASVYQTRMCIFINGWIPSKDVERLRGKLADVFGRKVVLEEKEMREEDLERVPSVLKNPSYFKPFELFTRLLPLPLYASYDPTPFIGIFFPLFFGMILGDAGYGLILGIVSLILMKKFKTNSTVHDGAKILGISSLYSIFFGGLFCEFFGDLPRRLFGIEPIFIERSTAFLPMLYFALSVGVVHIILGLFLGVMTAFKKKAKREAIYKILNFLVILSLIAVLASSFGLFPELLTRPIIIGILFLTPFLFFTGGVLAPLELLKSIGNIISYARIMAIGLTSVLLAVVANRLGGQMGNIVIGAVVAGMLHLLNIILGVFAPTIHSLRLHYVEFFSKFFEPGGKKFEPLTK